MFFWLVLSVVRWTHRYSTTVMGNHLLTLSALIRQDRLPVLCSEIDL